MPDAPATASALRPRMVHDYTTPRLRWGWNIYVLRYDECMSELAVFAIGRGVAPGDVVLLSLRLDGAAAGERVTWAFRVGDDYYRYLDPGDNWTATLTRDDGFFDHP